MSRRPLLSRPATLAALAAFAAATSLGGCAVGPNYKRPPVDVGTEFKEADGWKLAQPSDAADRGDWWTVFNDPVLSDLEKKVEVSNQTLIQAEAAYTQAKALVEQAESNLFPNLTGTGSIVRSKSATVPGVPGSAVTDTEYAVKGTATWELDVWGGIRRQIESAKDAAKASEYDIANAKLSEQITLATDYMNLREQDEAKRLLDQTVAAYAKTLEVTKNKYAAGVAAESDVLTAETTLQTAQAEAVDVASTRAALEHAIAVLAGEPPSKLTIAARTTFNIPVPDIPAGMPSALLERRPDVAAAERTMASANAEIGVNEAGFFPTLTLGGSDGFTSTSLGQLFSAPANNWSIGPTLTQTIFDAGATQGRVRAAQAVYRQDVAVYRQTVLTALQQVEDAVAALRVLQVEEQVRYSASKEADQAEAITVNQYQAGTVDETTLVVAEATALSARETAVATTLSRLENVLNLISALGGGWQPTHSKMG